MSSAFVAGDASFNFIQEVVIPVAEAKISSPRSIRELDVKRRQEVKAASQAFENSIKQQIWRLTRPELSGVPERVVKQHYFSEISAPLLLLSSEIRQEFLCNLSQQVMDEQRQVTRHFLDSEFYKILRFTSKSDRLELVKFILDRFTGNGTSSGRPAIDLVSRVLQESKSVKELRWILNNLKDYRLENRRNSKLKELLAISDLPTRLVHNLYRHFPQKVNKYAGRQVIRKRLPAVRKWIKNALEICSESAHAETQLATNLRHALRHALSLVRKIEKTADPTKMREYYNILKPKLALELKLGLCLSSGKDNKNTLQVLWTESNIKTVRDVYTALPDLLILTTTKLHRVELARVFKDQLSEWYGYVDGEDGATYLSLMTEREQGDFAMQRVAVHELGHSLQIGDSSMIPSINGSGQLIGAHHPRSDFLKFLDLAGWTLFVNFTFNPDETEVTIAGRSYDLGRDVFYNGSQGRFTYEADSNLVYFVETTRRETLPGINWMTSPWEHFAWMFDAYILFSHPGAFENQEAKNVPAYLLRYFEDLFGLNTRNKSFQKYIANAGPEVDLNAEKIEEATSLFKAMDIGVQSLLLTGLLRITRSDMRIQERLELAQGLLIKYNSEKLEQMFLEVISEHPRMLKSDLLKFMQSRKKLVGQNSKVISVNSNAFDHDQDLIQYYI